MINFVGLAQLAIKSLYSCFCDIIQFSILLQGCEREVAEAEKGSSDELKSECLLRLSWALVHSKRSEDVQRGIAMLEGKHIYSDIISEYEFGYLYFSSLVIIASFGLFLFYYLFVYSLYYL